MYETQLESDWAYILADSRAKVCFVADTKLYECVTKLRPRCPELAQIIPFDGKVEEVSFQALLALGGVRLPAPSPALPTDVASIIYTSGTTGKPKGVELTHRNLVSNVRAIVEATPVRPGERSVGFLPWAHVYGGCLELNTAVVSGGSVAICPDATKLLEYLVEVRPTVLFAVPRVWNRIYDASMSQLRVQPRLVQRLFHHGMSAASKRRRGAPASLMDRAALLLARRLIFSRIVAKLGGRLRFAFSGAAALSVEVAEFIDNLGVEVYEGYGMTEAAGAITTNSKDERRIGSVGKPVPGVRIELDESVAGANPGEGEIIVYSPGIMAGYHELRAATRGTLTRDGGLRTGDVGRFDADGYLYITGRVKELFKLSNGRYVAPAALEEKLQLSPFIDQCMVYGDDMPHVVALIVVDRAALEQWARERGMSATIEVLLNDYRTHELYVAELDRLGASFKGYEKIREFILDTERLTTENGMLTPTFKVKRRNVLSKYASAFRRLYESTPPISGGRESAA
jgi:long-chain acyl-CoA synthetase